MINKCIAHIINNRLSEHIEPTLRPSQCGFRPNRSCVDHINTLRIIVEQSVEWRSPLYLTFIDFKCAFDSIKHSALWSILERTGVPPKLINITKALYEEASCRVMHRGRSSSNIPILSGVKQGCPLSPLLFNIVLDWTLKNVNFEQLGITWGLQNQLHDLDYADDICLLAHTHAAMQTKLNRLIEQAKIVGLEININKTKTMRVNVNNQQPLTIDNKPIEDVQKFCYLGSIITVHGGTEEDIKQRISKARLAFGNLKDIWNSTHLTTKSKLRIFNTNVKSVLLYGCETWKSSIITDNKIQVFINRCLRRIMRIHWMEFVTNKELWQRAGQTDIKTEIRHRKWKWIGHSLRREGSNTARMVLDWNPQGSRKRGRPKMTWRRTIQQEIQRTGRTWREVKQMAQNRIRWKLFVEALCST